MTKILVRPDDLQALSEWFVQTAGQMRQIGVRMGAVPSGLDWQVREAVGIEQQALGARSRALALADQCDAMAKFLRTRAGLFRAADGRGLGEMAVTAEEYRDLMEGHQMGGSGPDGRNAARHLRTGAVAGGVAATLPVMGAVGLLERENPGLFGPPPGPSGERLPTPAETRLIQRVLGVDELGYGPKTRAAVAAFQRAHGIPVDGKVMIGPRTWNALLKEGGWDGQVPKEPAPVTTAPSEDHTVPIESQAANCPTNAPHKNWPGNRNSQEYAAVIDQFHVETNDRYVPRDKKTFCNIYVWDVTRAMGAELPHWVYADGSPAEFGHGSELPASAVAEWLAHHGPARGWRQVSAVDAQTLANEGYPVVAAYDGEPAGRTGHVAMVRPGEYDAVQGPAIAQAGGKNLNQTTVRNGFGADIQGEVHYWVHD